MVIDEFRATVRCQLGMLIIDLHGVVNADAKHGLQAAYDRAESCGVSFIVLNFGHVEYMNSTGMAHIVHLLSEAQQAKRRVGVYGLSEHYRLIFRVTRLDEFMSIYVDEASALASIGEPVQ